MKFWKGYKKFPQPLELHFSDYHFNKFVESVVNIYSYIFNITLDSQVDVQLILKQNIQKIENSSFIFNFNETLSDYNFNLYLNTVKE